MRPPHRRVHMLTPVSVGHFSSWSERLRNQGAARILAVEANAKCPLHISKCRRREQAPHLYRDLVARFAGIDEACRLASHVKCADHFVPRTCACSGPAVDALKKTCALPMSAGSQVPHRAPRPDTGRPSIAVAPP